MNKCKFNILVAACSNYGIGYQGGFPWPVLQNEMRHFRQLTQNGIVIMGRKTYNSIPLRNRPLPNRLNIVLSTTTDASDYPPSVLVFRSLNEALQALDHLLAPESHSLHYHAYRNSTIWVIGGQQAYEEALTVARDRCHRIYYTHIYADLPADTFFPMHLVLDDDYQSMNNKSIAANMNAIKIESNAIEHLLSSKPQTQWLQRQEQQQQFQQQSLKPLPPAQPGKIAEAVLSSTNGVSNTVAFPTSVVNNSWNYNNNHKYPIAFRQISVSEHSAPSSFGHKQVIETHPNQQQQQQQEQNICTIPKQVNQQLINDKSDKPNDKQFTIPTNLQVEGSLCYEYRLYESVRS